MKRDVRQAIIEAGADLVRRQGFHHTGLKEILAAAGVPKGSFYFYFPSKEDFGLALIEHYARAGGDLAKEILGQSDVGPVQRLERLFVTLRERMEERGCESGCPIGNLAQEISDLSPTMREAVSKVLRGFAGSFARVLAEASSAGEIAPDLEPEPTAAFILDAWEGALMRMKAEKSIQPLLRFEDYVFRRLLR